MTGNTNKYASREVARGKESGGRQWGVERGDVGY